MISEKRAKMGRLFGQSVLSMTSGPGLDISWIDFGLVRCIWNRLEPPPLAQIFLEKVTAPCIQEKTYYLDFRF